MLLVGGLTAIAAGVFCFTDSEMAWHLYERDNQMWGQSVHQPRNWRDLVHYMGIFLIFLGSVAIILGLPS